MYRSARRGAHTLVSHAGDPGRWRRRDDRGRPRAGAGSAASCSGGVPARARVAVRLLHAGLLDDRDRFPARASGPERRGDPARAGWPSLPLHRLPEHRAGGPAGQPDARRGYCACDTRGGVRRPERAVTTRMIGARIPRNEDPRLLRGLGCFVDDVNPAGVLHAACYRSPHAHARLRALDVSRAHAVPGVHLVVTAAELGELNQPGPLLIPHPALTQPRTPRPLAVHDVRYVGEAIAFVVADDRYIAEDAAGLIVADYEPLPVVVDLDRALVTDTPLVHADVPSNRAARFSQRVGDPDQAFRHAAHILRERLVMRRRRADTA